jgi:hypothetical protein
MLLCLAATDGALKLRAETICERTYLPVEQKTCPKCSAKNDSANNICANCYTSLEGIAAATVEENDKAAPARTLIGLAPGWESPETANSAPAAQPSTDRELTQTLNYRPQQQPGPAPQKPPGAEFNLRPYREGIQPEKTGFNPLPVVLFVIVAVLGALVWRMLQPPPPPAVPADSVLQSFLEAKKTGDFDNVAPYICQDDVLQLRNVHKTRESSGITWKEGVDMLLFNIAPTREDLETGSIQSIAIHTDSERSRNVAKKKKAVVVRAVILMVTPSLTLSMKDVSLSMPEQARQETYDFILILENNEWKADLVRTKAYEANGDLSEMMIPQRPSN